MIENSMIENSMTESLMTENLMTQNLKTENLKSKIREVPDFPQPGVLFRDIFPLLACAKTHAEVMRQMLSLFDLTAVTAFVGIESRGFILAAGMATAAGKGFVPLRKAGKLPPPTVRAAYSLEYGQAELEIAAGHGGVVIVDDVLATGGTLRAAIALCERAGYMVHDVGVLINLKSLNAFDFRGESPKALLTYE
jgi:adenine phosphoribosyltransferase